MPVESVHSPFQFCPSLSFFDIALANGLAEPFGELFDPGCQRLNRLLVRLCSLWTRKCYW